MFEKGNDQFGSIIKKIEELKADPEFERKEDDLFILYKLATTDQKTSLYNYRFFSFILEREIERSTRYKRPFSLLLIDVDNFKQVNGTYGHLKGDILLERLARVIQKSIRMNDTAARFGGEEFIILLPETNEQKAWQIAERLRIKVVSDETLGNCDVSISTGVSFFQGQGYSSISRYDPSTFKDVIRQADNALAWAKKTGKNKCITFSSIPGN